MRPIRIFIASPKDCATERKQLATHLNALAGMLADTFRVSLHVSSQDTLHPDGGNAESNVLRQINFDQLDIWVGIVKNRFGTPTGNVALDGSSVGSGTEEEFEGAYEKFKCTGRPRIFLYRIRATIKSVDNEAVAQANKLNEFFKRLEPGGTTPALHVETAGSEFIAKAISHVLRAIIESTRKKDLPDGVIGVFGSETNEERNAAKRAAILASKSCRLAATSGTSFLAMSSVPFKGEVLALLERGGKFEALLLDPWSYGGLSVALAEKGENFEFSGVDSLTDTSLLLSDPVEIIANSTGYKFSFDQVLDHVNSLMSRYPQHLAVRLYGSLPAATILLTEHSCFFEPYSFHRLDQRQRLGLHTHELQLATTSSYAKRLAEQIDSAWLSAISLAEWVRQVDARKQHLRFLFKALGDRSPVGDSRIMKS